jgi:hypothetical protein
MRFPETATAPSQIGGCEMGRTTRALKIMSKAALSNPCFLAASFSARSGFMFARFVFVSALPKLLLDLFDDQIDGCVEIALSIFREEIRPGDGEAHGTGELALRSFGFVMLQDDPRIYGETVQVVQFVEPARKMIFNGFGERHVMR